MYLLDTNIISYYLKNQYPDLTARIMSHSPSDLYVSAITLFEFEYGASKKNWGAKNRMKLAMALAPFQIVPFSTDDAIQAGKARAYLQKTGMIIGPYDVQLAGQALARNMIFVTHNTKEFERVPNLKLEDWV